MLHECCTGRKASAVAGQVPPTARQLTESRLPTSTDDRAPSGSPSLAITSCKAAFSKSTAVASLSGRPERCQEQEKVGGDRGEMGVGADLALRREPPVAAAA